MTAIERATTLFRRWCFPNDDQYFDLERAVRAHPTLNHQTASFEENDQRFSIRTHDDYLIEIMKKDMYPFKSTCWFNGYFSVPSSSFVLRDIIRETPDYDEFSYRMNFSIVELTYGDGIGKFGWDHGHTHDHNMYSRHVRPYTIVSGPVQVLEEAMKMIEILRKEEERILMKQKAEDVHVYYQELMEKTWHPSRVEKWIDAGCEV